MSNNLEYHPTENVPLSFALNKQGREDVRNSSAYEDSRDDIVIVKNEERSKLPNAEKLCKSRGIAIQKLQAECNKMKEELKRADVDLESCRRTFETVTGELKKQLDVSKKRESESLTKTMCLRLENEKLHVLLASEQNLVDKLKKELLNVKRVLKFAIKDICNVSRSSESFLDCERSPKGPRTPRSPQSARSPRVRFADLMDTGLKTRHET